MDGVAVNVTDAPAHVGLLPVVIAAETAGVTVGLIVIVIPVLVAVAGLAQAAFDVSIHVTTWLFVNVVVV